MKRSIKNIIIGSLLMSLICSFPSFAEEYTIEEDSDIAIVEEVSDSIDSEAIEEEPTNTDDEEPPEDPAPQEEDTQYTIEYELSGGTNNALNTATYTKSTPLTLSAPTRTGFNFLGWYDNPDFSGTPITVVENGSVSKVYANWKSITYTLILHANNGTDTINRSVDVNRETGVILPKCSESFAGKTFNNWNTSPDGSGTTYNVGDTLFDVDTGLGDTYDLYGMWKSVKFNITFDGNGATSGTTKPMTGLSRDSYYPLSANGFKKIGYAFGGWAINGSEKIYTDKEQIKDLGSGSENVTLSAVWIGNEYSLVYQGNGGSYLDNTGKKTTSYKQTLHFGEEEILEPKEFSKPGYVFVGWNTNKKGTGKTYNTEDSDIFNFTSKLKGKATLYAMWRPVKYTVLFDTNSENLVNDVEGELNSIETEYGKTISLPSNPFTCLGYSFNGWNTKADGSGQKIKNKAKIKNLSTDDEDEITLYGQWTLNTYSVKFNLNKGKATNKANFATQTDLSVAGKQAIIPSEVLSRNGKKHIGWNTKANGKGDHYNFGDEVTLPTQKNKQTITLYAEWDEGLETTISRKNYSVTVPSGKTIRISRRWLYNFDVFDSKGNVIYTYTNPSEEYIKTDYTNWRDDYIQGTFGMDYYVFSTPGKYMLVFQEGSYKTTTEKVVNSSGAITAVKYISKPESNSRRTYTVNVTAK